MRNAVMLAALGTIAVACGGGGGGGSDSGPADAVTVKEPRIYACDESLGLLSYDLYGGAPVVLNPLAAPGSSLPDWSHVGGSAAVPGGLYLLETTDGTRTNKLFHYDASSNEVSLVHDFATDSERYLGLVRNSLGDLYTLDVAAGHVLKYSPATGTASVHSTSAIEGTLTALAIDARDRLYAQELMPGRGAPWVWRIDPSGDVAVALLNPAASTDTKVSAGLASRRPGILYLATRGGGILGAFDFNDDSDFLDGAELWGVPETFSGLSGLAWSGESILANDIGAGVVHRLQFDVEFGGSDVVVSYGKAVVWSTPAVQNAWDLGMIEPER